MGSREKVARLRELIAAFLPDYIRLADPDVAPHLDLSDVVPRAPREISAACRPGAVVADVRSFNGETVHLHVRVEPEAGPDTAGKALVRSLRALRLPLGEPAWLSAVFLRGGRPGINLETVRAASLAGLDTVRLYYTAFGLEASRAEYYLARPEPLAWALSALMKPEGCGHRRACEKRIRCSGLDEACRAFLLSCVDSFVATPTFPPLRVALPPRC